jgi:hypothetical protein
MAAMPIARRLTEQRMRELAGAPVESLAELTAAPVEAEITTDDGAKYRMKTYAFWDDEPWQSDLYVRVKTTGKGLRFFERYSGVETRDPDKNVQPWEGDGVEPDVRPTWVEVLAWAGCLASLLAVLGAVAFLASLLL